MEGAKNVFEFAKGLNIDNEIYNFSWEEYNKVLDAKPWRKEISALALVKMVTHANLGGQIEIMGLMQGRADKDSFIICDAFALPVEGTETRVNAGELANEYIAAYSFDCDKIKRKESMCGWYHSHPSYGCWLSGIDVNTQDLYQKQDPWVAIVIDPIRTITNGKVEIGAFRTYPENYSPPGEVAIEDQVIPLEKIEDFGVHYKRYYSLEISFYKTSRDAEIIDVLWHKYWISNLTQNSLFSNRKYFADGICDLGKKTEKILKGQRKDAFFNIQDFLEKEKKHNVRDFTKLSLERNQAFTNEAIKLMLFSNNLN